MNSNSTTDEVYMFEKMKPLRDCLLVQRVEKEEKSAGGIYFPDSAKEEKSQIGRVLAVGSGKHAADGSIIPMQVQVDDLVFFGKFSGIDAEKDLVVLREDEIFGVIDKK